jgi:hypothetical protein
MDILATMAGKPVHNGPSPAGSSPSGPSTSGSSTVVSTVPDLLVDHLDALRVLRAPDEQQRDRLLEQIGAHGTVEKEIVRELSAVRPLRHPDRFEEAHRLMMRSIEVLDRNGSRAAAIHGLAFLKPIAQWLVQQTTRWIVRSHLNRLLNRIGGIYERREANSGWSTPEHSMLRRARLDVRRVQSGMNGKALGLPAFLLGGAFITSIASTLQSVPRQHDRSGPSCDCDRPRSSDSLLGGALQRECCSPENSTLVGSADPRTVGDDRCCGQAPSR